MKISLPLFLNTIILLTLLFTVNLLGLSFLRIPIWLKILLAIMLSCAVSALAFIRWRSKSIYRTKIKQSKKQLACDLMLLNTLGRSQITEIFSALFKNLKQPAEEKQGYFLVSDTTVYPYCLPESLGYNEIKQTVDSSPFKSEKFLIISDGFKEGVKIYSGSLKAILITTETVVPLLNKYGLLPKNEKQEIKKKNLFKALFKKANGGHFLIYGITLIAMSFIVFYPIYYVVSGVLFAVFGLIALFFGKIDTVGQDEDLLSALAIDEPIEE